MANALRKGEEAVAALLDKYPDLVNEVSTGGATPLHMCGMGRDNEKVTAFIISRGGDVHAKDTYGYMPLHRMASNNLAIGAEALLKAGADVNARTEHHGETPLSIAMEAHATAVIQVLKNHGARSK
jgi:ankyrin repeat protein